jgi:hypothetical protein
MDTFEAEQAGGALIWQIICSSVCGNYGGGYTTVHPPTSTVSSGMAQVAALANASSGTSAGSETPPPPAADFTLTATASPNPVAPGQAVTVTSQVTASAAASGLNVDVEILDAANLRVAQQLYLGQTFAAGTPRSFPWSWPGTTTTGAYTVKIGVFSADWATLHEWNNQAATISVQPAPSAPTDFTLSASVSPTQVVAGETVAITAQVRASAPASNVTVHLQIHDVADVKVAERSFTGQSFATADTTRSYSWNWPSLPTTGLHTVKIGVFSADWTTLHEWNNAAASFTVSSGSTLKSSDLSQSTVASPATIRQGQTVTVQSQITSLTAVSQLQVSLEIYNQAGARVAQQICTLTLAAGQTKPCTWSNAGSLSRGTYTVKLGLFSADWALRYRWYKRATTFKVTR